MVLRENIVMGKLYHATINNGYNKYIVIAHQISDPYVRCSVVSVIRGKKPLEGTYGYPYQQNELSEIADPNDILKELIK